ADLFISRKRPTVIPDVVTQVTCRCEINDRLNLAAEVDDRDSQQKAPRAIARPHSHPSQPGCDPGTISAPGRRDLKTPSRSWLAPPKILALRDGGQPRSAGPRNWRLPVAIGAPHVVRSVLA